MKQEPASPRGVALPGRSSTGHRAHRLNVCLLSPQLACIPYEWRLVLLLLAFSNLVLSLCLEVTAQLPSLGGQEGGCERGRGPSPKSPHSQLTFLLPPPPQNFVCDCDILWQQLCYGRQREDYPRQAALPQVEPFHFWGGGGEARGSAAPELG